jgi:hypothetical protein
MGLTGEAAAPAAIGTRRASLGAAAARATGTRLEVVATAAPETTVGAADGTLTGAGLEEATWLGALTATPDTTGLPADTVDGTGGFVVEALVGTGSAGAEADAASERVTDAEGTADLTATEEGLEAGLAVGGLAAGAEAA